MSTTKDNETKSTTPVATTQPKPAPGPDGKSPIQPGNSDFPNETVIPPPPSGPTGG